MILIRKVDEAPSYEGPVVFYITEGLDTVCTGESTFCSLSEIKWRTRDCLYGWTPRTQTVEGMAETISSVPSCPVFKAAQNTWAVAAWRFIPPPRCSSPGSCHCHFIGKGPWIQSFPENWMEVLELLVGQEDREPHYAKKEKYSLWLAFPLISCSYTQPHRQADQIFLVQHERTDSVVANTVFPRECLGGTRGNLVVREQEREKTQGCCSRSICRGFFFFSFESTGHTHRPHGSV